MVSATATAVPPADRIDSIASGLAGEDRELLARALEFARDAYRDRLLGTGEGALEHALGLAEGAANLRLDAQARAAGLLFAVPAFAQAREFAGREAAQEGQAAQHPFPEPLVQACLAHGAPARPVSK